MENLAFYNAGRSVPPEAQKAFNNGKFSGTDINPMWRIKKLTELFGPCGIGWYVGNVKERCEEHGEVTMAIVNLTLFVKVNGEWSQPIYGTGGNILLRKGAASDEGYKMAYTDALSVACKALGIGADVYFEKDRTKYTEANIALSGSPVYEATKEKPLAEIPVAKEPEKFVCADCGNLIRPWVVDGKTKMNVRQIATQTEKKYGRRLCLECGAKEKEKANA